MWLLVVACTRAGVAQALLGLVGRLLELAQAALRRGPAAVGPGPVERKTFTPIANIGFEFLDAPVRASSLAHL